MPVFSGVPTLKEEKKPYTIFVTRQGAKILKYNGYTYFRKSWLYWQCVRKTCPGRGITLPMPGIFILKESHNHG
jgi:FLYWCH zinc finger domain